MNIFALIGGIILFLDLVGLGMIIYDKVKYEPHDRKVKRQLRMNALEKKQENEETKH